MPAFKERIEKQLQQREQLGLERKLQAKGGGNSTLLHQDGKSFNNFSSNDYLGLASCKELIGTWQENLSIYGSGSSASPLVVGQSYAHQKLQDALCDWLGYSRAVLFSSGFSANQAVLFSLLKKSDLLIQDKLNHASLMEAGMLCNAKMKRFAHNDVSQMNRLLQSDLNTLVVTEGVFSMDGDKAPLAEIYSQCQDNNAWLMVDDAHGIGVLGDEGRGSCAQAGIKPELLIVTFGKAMGMSGAAVMCDEHTSDYLIQFAKHFVYSTAMPPAQAATLSYAVKVVREQPWRREKLCELQHHYHMKMSSLEGYVATDTPIKPLIVGSSGDAVKIACSLQADGHWVSAIRPPTVPVNASRIRVTLSASHSTAQITALADSIKEGV